MPEGYLIIPRTVYNDYDESLLTTLQGYIAKGTLHTSPPMPTMGIETSPRDNTELVVIHMDHPDFIESETPQRYTVDIHLNSIAVLRQIDTGDPLYVYNYTAEPGSAPSQQVE